MSLVSESVNASVNAVVGPAVTPLRAADMRCFTITVDCRVYVIPF